MRCPSCGAAYRADAKFCPRDGTLLISPAQGGAGAEVPAAMPGAAAIMRAIAADPPPSAGHGSLAGSVLDDRYRIVRKVGEGGMAIVYLANDVATGERFAIKVLSPALAKDPNAMARLRREAGLGVRLAHPNICHIMRLGETGDGLAYIVMPFVEGELLSDRTHRMGRIPLADAVRYVKDIAAGLQLAHSMAIVHRDLKPENVMICPQSGGEDRAVVLDFGLAKERRTGPELEKLTATGIVLGTPEFMSPEQLRGKSLDGRSDIYSLALMTFEMLTGQLPFAGRTQQELMVNRLRSEPLGIRRVRPELGFTAALEKVLLRGMQRSADDRYATAPEFAAALEAAARDEGGEEAGLLGRLFGR
jgi:serine/threonine-protein kinase